MLHKLFYSLLLSSTFVVASDYKTVFDKNIHIDKNHKIQLKLFQENILLGDYSNKPAKLEVYSLNDSAKKLYTFVDQDEDFPLYYYNGVTFNNKKKSLVNLLHAVNVFDIDNDGKNEILIAGEHYEMMGGSSSKIIILGEENDKIIQKTLPIVGDTLCDIQYSKKENVIILAQSSYTAELQDDVTYAFAHYYIYDIEDNFKKISLFKSDKKVKWLSTGSDVIKQNLSEILKKYKKLKASKKD